MAAGISLSIVNYDLQGMSLDRARKLVEIGEGRFVRSKLATLKFVNPYYELSNDEQFVEEEAHDHWVPSWVGDTTGATCGDGGPHVPSRKGDRCDRCGDERSGQ
jgi:hypothetical protein